VAPNHAELTCLQLAFAYDEATHWSARPLPSLLSESHLNRRDVPVGNDSYPSP
jgi:hypothetical protein